MKTILSIGKKHPARSMDFSVLLDGLLNEVQKGNVNIAYHPEHPELAVFKYSLQCVAERRWNVFSLMARGLILDLEQKQVIATPFVKFFNYSEIENQSVSVVEKDFTVTEKMDGSLGIGFFFKNQWKVSTCGSFVSEQARWAQQWMNDYLDFSHMNETNTYLFEIIYKENKIVIDYDYEGMVLLAVIDQFGFEYCYTRLKTEASLIKSLLVKLYNFNDMNSIIETAKELDRHHEGYVIRFINNGVRLKIKGDEYVRLHKIISRVTPLAIWESLLKKDDFTELRKSLPEEIQKDFDMIVSLLMKKLETFLNELEDIYRNTQNKSDKELGLYMSIHPESFDGGMFPQAKKFVFIRRKGVFYEKFENPESIVRRKVFMMFRPKANVLEGYKPSSVMNRFNDDL